MKWTSEAEERIQKAPFFIRGFARKKAEEMAIFKGKTIVELGDIEEAKGSRELEDISNIDLSIEGLQNSKYREIMPCGGLKGCPLTLFNDEEVILLLERVLKETKLEEFMRKQLEGPVLYHHKFKAAVSGCPNCCSQPQIKDVGIIGYSRPKLNKGYCVGCGQCVEACPEGLIKVDEEPSVNFHQCIACGRCIQACPTNSIVEGEKGYSITIGGRLGRRPFLAKELSTVESLEELEKVLVETITIYQQLKAEGKSFSHRVEALGINAFIMKMQGK